MTDTPHDTDRFEYECYIVGRVTRDVEVPTDDGDEQLTEGQIRFEPRCEEDLDMVRAEDGWMSHFLDLDADDPVLAGAHVSHDLLGVLWFPEPMTDADAADWLEANPERWRQFREEEIEQTIECDISAADLLDGGLR